MLNAAMSATLAFQKSERGSLPYGFGIFSDVKNTYGHQRQETLEVKMGESENVDNSGDEGREKMRAKVN